MDIAKFKVGDLGLEISVDAGDLVVSERYPILKPLEDLIDIIEKAIPGDQAAQAAILKALLEAKIK